MSPRELQLGPGLRLVFEDPQGHGRAFHSPVPNNQSLLASILLQPGTPSTEPSASELENRVYAEVEGHGRSFATLEQRPDRGANEPASPGCLLRFEFSPSQLAALRVGAEFGFGIDDDRMRVGAMVKRELRASLLAELG